VVPVIVDDLYPDNLELIGIHRTDGFQTPWGDNRMTVFYTYEGVPNFWVDSMTNVLGWYGNANTQIAQWSARINVRLAVPTDITIDVYTVELDPPTGTFEANVCMEAGGSERSVRVFMVQVLDHYPDYVTYTYRNTVRAGFQVGDYPLTPGECEQVQQAFTLGSVDLQNSPNIKIVAWAQDPVDDPPAEVHQVGSDWPFRVLYDGFESGDLSGWSVVFP
jgi:hypothetical protein